MKGSTFSMALKLEVVRELEKASSAYKYCIGMVILLIQDGYKNQKWEKLTLDHLGCSVDYITNPSEAFSAIQENQSSYDVIILDLYQGKISWKRFTKKVREFERINQLRATPIVVLIDNFTREDKKYGQLDKIQISHFIQKPLKSEDISRALKTIRQNQLKEEIVLILDPDQFQSTILSQMLNKISVFKVEVVHHINRQKLIKFIQENLTILRTIFVSHSITGMHGIEVIQLVRSLDTERSVKLVMLSEQASQVLKIEAIQAGADYYAARPLTIEHLKKFL